MAKPTYNDVDRAYHGREYLAKHFPCPDVVNQCAIRMSVALQRSGFTIEGFSEPRRIHGTPLRPCAFNEPHIVGATELMKHLIKTFGLTRAFSKGEIKSAYAALSGKRGIVYFDNLGGRKGDHIDLFDGTAIYNEIRDYKDYGHEGGHVRTDTANRGRYTESHYFLRAQRIDFIQLM